MRGWTFVSWLACAALLFAACGDGEGEGEGADVVASGTSRSITVSAAWARPAPEVGGDTAFYMTIDNHGEVHDTLTGATAPVCGATEIHMTTVTDDVMSMEVVPGGITVTAGATLKLGPGALHLMCIEVAETLAEGATTELTLEFANAGTIAVIAQVRPSE